MQMDRFEPSDAALSLRAKLAIWRANLDRQLRERLEALAVDSSPTEEG